MMILPIVQVIIINIVWIDCDTAVLNVVFSTDLSSIDITFDFPILYAFPVKNILDS